MTAERPLLMWCCYCRRYIHAEVHHADTCGLSRRQIVARNDARRNEERRRKEAA